MSSNQTVLRGMLKPDGTLQLDSPPNLPAGPVEVLLRSLLGSNDGSVDWWEYLQLARAEAEACGAAERTGEEIETERNDFRGGDERVEQLNQVIRRDGNEEAQP